MRKYLLTVKIIAITALFCTLFVCLGFWASSLVPAEKSGELTNKVEDKVDSSFNIQDKIDSEIKTQSIKLSIPNQKQYYFYDDHPQIIATILPEDSTDIEVEFSIETASVNGGEATIDENGVVTFNKKGLSVVKATLKSDSSIWSTFNINCSGEDPFLNGDPTVELQVGSFSDMQIGVERNILFNNGKTTVTCADCRIEDTSIVEYIQGYFYPKKIGTTNLITTVKNGTQTKEIVTPISVTSGTIEDITKIIFKDAKDIKIEHEGVVNIYDLLDGVDRNNRWNRFKVTSSDDNILHQTSDTMLKASGFGKVTLTYTSVYTSEITASIDIEVDNKPIDYIKIVGPDSLMPSMSAQYTAEAYPINYNQYFEWSVIKGNATITQDGQLKVDSFGKIIIRCQSTLDPNVYVDHTIQVKLYTSAYYFVRKFMGHMGLSALFGFGLFFTAIFLCSKKWQTVFIIPVSFGYAGISELLQKLAPGRYCLFSDVLVDFEGALIGMAVGLALYLLILLIWRLVNKESFNKLKIAMNAITFTTVFKRTDHLLDNLNKNQSE